MRLHHRLAAPATALVLSAPLLLQAAPAALAASCPAVEAIAVPGTSQTNPQADPDKPVGVLANILEPLRKNSPVRLVTYYTPYPATIVGGTDGGGYRASKNAGIDATNARLRAVAGACPNTAPPKRRSANPPSASNDPAWASPACAPAASDPLPSATACCRCALLRTTTATCLKVTS